MFLKVVRRVPRGALKVCWGAVMQQGGATGFLESKTKIQPQVKTTIPYSYIFTNNRCQQILQGSKAFTLLITIALAVRRIWSGWSGFNLTNFDIISIVSMVKPTNFATINKFPNLWQVEKLLVLALPTSYLVERGFSAVVQLQTKQINRLDISQCGDFRLLLADMKPDVKRISTIITLKYTILIN